MTTPEQLQEALVSTAKRIRSLRETLEPKTPITFPWQELGRLREGLMELESEIAAILNPPRYVVKPDQIRTGSWAVVDTQSTQSHYLAYAICSVKESATHIANLLNGEGTKDVLA